MIALESVDLVRALRRVVPVLPSRGGIPIHSCVRIEANGAGVLFSATDGIRSVQTVVGGEQVVRGILAVPGATLAKIASTLPAGPVELVPGKGHVEVRAGKSRFKIPAFDSGDLPPLHEEAGEVFLAVGAKKLGEALGAVRHAVSDDASRPHLSGVLVELDAGGVMRAVATDGHRLVLHRSPVEGVEKARALFVPGAALPMIAALCAEHPDHVVAVRRRGAYILASAASTTVAVREVEAKFPPYAQIIPAESARGTSAEVDRKALLDAVARVAVVITGQAGLRVQLGADSVALSAAGPDVGEASDDVVAVVAGAAKSVGLNAAYVVDALRSSACSHATVSVAGELEPVVITTLETTSVIMPMRI